MTATKTKTPPFRMLPARRAVLTCDGKFVVGGRASHVWETYLARRVAGVPGTYCIRLGQTGAWHTLDWTMDEAEAAFRGGATILTRRRADRALTVRQARIRRGLEVG